MKIIETMKSKLNRTTAAVVAVPVAASLLATASSSYAGISELFAAVDVDGVETHVQTFMIALIGIGLLFFGYALLKRLRVAV